MCDGGGGAGLLPLNDLICTSSHTHPHALGGRKAEKNNSLYLVLNNLLAQKAPIVVQALLAVHFPAINK